MKLIHFADWQLGIPFDRFDPDVRGALTEARFDAVDALGEPPPSMARSTLSSATPQPAAVIGR